jgi:hypothetical protein
MVMQVRDLSTGQLIQLPIHPVRGNEWYAEAWRRGIPRSSGLETKRNKKRLSGQSVAKVMKVYAEFDWLGGDLALSQEKLAGRAGLSAFTARRAQQWLVEHGWMVIVGRFKKAKHGWKVVLTIPDDSHDPTAYVWGPELHPERAVEWVDDTEWRRRLRLVEE